MAEKWEKREGTFSYFEQEVHGWEVVEVYGAAYTVVALCFDEKDADRIVLDHELARLAERIKVTALQDGFWVNPRVTEDYDPETEQYALLVDNTQGDKGHPLLECYYREPLLAILDALKAQATGGQ